MAKKNGGNGGFTHLMSPGHIGSLAIRNRILMCPMGDNIATPEGMVTEQQMAYYEARARGGVGLIILGSASVMWPEGASTPMQTAISDDRFIPGVAALARRVQAHGARFALQLVHGGKTAPRDVAAGRPMFVPSLPDGEDVPDPIMAMITPAEGAAMSQAYTAPGAKVAFHAMTKDDIAAVADAFAAAVERAKRAGVDACELHAGHGYLIHNFLSPVTNHRTDEYGGSVDNRARFLTDILRAIRARVGRDYPVWCRISAHEYFMKGITIEDAKRTAVLAEAAGADAIHVSTYADPGRAIGYTEAHTTHFPGHFLPYAAEIKHTVKIPIIAVGRIEPERGEEIIAKGDADFVAMGRKLLADPELPNKLLEGRREDVRPCIYQYRCIGQIFLLEPFRCSANPAMGHEAEFEIEPAATPRHVLVAGGGPGGLEAARVAALRGHRVTLCEEAEELGGTALLSSLVSKPNGELVDYLVTQIRKLAVTMRLNQKVTPALVRELRPDVVVVATGARHDTSGLRGADRANVFNGHDLRSLITGRDPALAAAKLSLSQRTLLGIGRLVGGALSMDRLRELTRTWMPLGKRVAILGGGLVGAELGEFLADRGRQVTIVEAGTVIGKEMALPRRWRAIHELRERGVVLLTEATVEEVTDAGVVYVDTTGVRQTVPADSVILAYGMVEDRSLADALAGIVPEVHVVGDCHGVGYIEGALRDATVVAMKI